MLKKVLLVVLVVFLLFWLVQAPNSFANAMQDGASWLWDMASRLFTSVIDVLDSLGS